MPKDADPFYKDQARYDREPVSDYKSALCCVVAHLIREGRTVDLMGPLPFEAKLIADIFWISDTTVRRDLRRFLRSIAGGDDGNS